MSGHSVRKRWGVLFASRAIRELHKLERDQSALVPVHKKIKELSNGMFSSENHRIVIGSSQHIPIYRAKAPNDIRIIYQIDVITETSGTFDHQVLKILQISNRARINYNLWAHVSARLNRRNSLYRDRCIYRPPPGNSGEWLPTRFPHDNYGSNVSVVSSDPEIKGLNDEESVEIQELMLERYIPFTKTVYNSILGDIELALPMVLDNHEHQIVSHKGATIVIGRSGTGKTTALIYKMRAVDQTAAADEVQHEGQTARQLFVTRSRVLAQHVETTYRGLAEASDVASKSPEELKMLAEQNRKNPDRALAEFDSEIDLRDDLPPRFTMLQASHFPLFISFDKLCSLIEADIRYQTPEAINDPKTRSIIGFDEFLHTYWPLFGSLTNTLEPNLVFSEIVGVIKGSQAALESKEGHLTRNAYTEELSRRQFPLLAQARSRIYSIFEIYNKHRSSRFDIDAADRTRTILKHFSGAIGDHKVDYLYVDEVQDNLMIDIYFLRMLCDDINDIYWSGDSAQTVVAGSAFRIKDLKAFTYRDQNIRSSGPVLKKVPARFTTFELSHNFRSLSGIVRYADSIVQALYCLFPESIDVMAPESAEHDGPPPVIFEGVQNETGFFENFLLESSASNRVVFGAQQAILVRDEDAAEKLDSKLQGLCNIMPIMSSKGLEFDDVLLYNFFSQSPASLSAWQYLLRGVTPNQKSTQFSPPPPAVLCSELKLLYVAITRARRRCWIWDGGEVLSALKAFWVARELVETESASQMVGRLASSSSQSQWAAKGREFFSHRLYKLAAACFVQAKQPNDAQISRAYHQMARANLKRLRGDTPDARRALLSAAEDMEECAKLSKTGDSRNLHYHAGTCFEAACEIYQAARSFAMAQRYEYAVELLFTAQDLAHGIDFLLEYRKELNVDIFARLLDIGRQHLFRHREYKRLPYLFEHNLDAQIAYAKKHDFKPQLKHILKENQQYDELAEVYVGEKKLEKGVSCYLEAFRLHSRPQSITLATDVVTAKAESATLIGGKYHKSSQEEAKRLIEVIQPYILNDADACLYVDLLESLITQLPIGLELVRTLDLNPVIHRRKVVLARHFALDEHAWIETGSLSEVLEYLDVWSSYTFDILEISNIRQPSRSSDAQALLGFAPVGSNRLTSTFRVLPESFLSSNGSLELSGSQVDRSVASQLTQLLTERLYKLHTALVGSSCGLLHHFQKLFSPSSSFSLLPAADLDHELQNYTQFLSKLLPILDVITGKERTTVIRIWLRRLFDIARLLSVGVSNQWSLRMLLDRDAFTPLLIKWLNYYSLRIWTSAVSNVVWPDAFMTLTLVLASDRAALKTVAENMRSSEQALNRIDHQNLVGDLISLLEFTAFDRLERAASALEIIVTPRSGIPVDIAVCFVELLTREIIFYYWLSRKSAQYGFSGLLVPTSWAKELLNRQADNGLVSMPSCQEYFNSVERISSSLRFQTPDHRLRDGQKISSGMMQILNLRL
ncbi:P-loop containing nucleoside triphosphate hydrolase protein [Ceratobasidium sp. AG-I]|nr:P-loop containing nucleoside triphosphate hydrolase protein [Ceratobasidium sp. AG-I]